MAIFDIYEHNPENTVRFLLGKTGKRNIFVLGLNPSTATDEKADATITRVQTVAQNNGFDGFFMINLYPLRATFPEDLPELKDQELISLNTEIILKNLKKETSPTIWCAWGGNIQDRKYLSESLNHLYQNSDELKVSWLNFGAMTKDGHPRHPSRLAYKWTFKPFDLKKYLTQWNFH